MTSDTLMQQVQELLGAVPRLRACIRTLQQQGARCVLVGGVVRDLLLQLPVKDIDIEVHGVTLEQLAQCLAQQGSVSNVGKSFGVLRVHGLDVDWSMPRKDSAGRKPQVTVDPHMSLDDAFRRRDLTMNAMGIDVATGELIDPFGGYEHLRAKVLHAPDAHLFAEDPLRFFRVMQFIGRFGMQPSAQLNELCKTMVLTDVSRERREAEYEKLLLKSPAPSLGLRWLKEIGRLSEILPELAATVGVAQEADWHPEGDVFEHSMQALDAAALMTRGLPDDLRLTLMYAALCHDLGKVTTTKLIDGRLRSFGHESAGMAPARAMLGRMTGKKDLVTTVCKLVKAHMIPGQFVENNASAAAYKRLACKLAPHTTIEQLTLLANADKCGRNGEGHAPAIKPITVHDTFLERARSYGVAQVPETPVLVGKDLLDVIPPGPALGEAVRLAYRWQIEKGIREKGMLRELVLKNLQG